MSANCQPGEGGSPAIHINYGHWPWLPQKRFLRGCQTPGSLLRGCACWRLYRDNGHLAPQPPWWPGSGHPGLAGQGLTDVGHILACLAHPEDLSPGLMGCRQSLPSSLLGRESFRLGFCLIKCFFPGGETEMAPEASRLWPSNRELLRGTGRLSG